VAEVLVDLGIRSPRRPDRSDRTYLIAADEGVFQDRLRLCSSASARGVRPLEPRPAYSPTVPFQQEAVARE
jgi:hypothetical protein